MAISIAGKWTIQRIHVYKYSALITLLFFLFMKIWQILKCDSSFFFFLWQHNKRFRRFLVIPASVLPTSVTRRNICWNMNDITVKEFSFEDKQNEPRVLAHTNHLIIKIYNAFFSPRCSTFGFQNGKRKLSLMLLLLSKRRKLPSCRNRKRETCQNYENYELLMRNNARFAFA